MNMNVNNITIGTPVLQPQGYKAFIPAAFPPGDGFALTGALLKKDTEATRLLGRLDGITRFLPDVDFFLLMYQRKDAASSSQIEGTSATMADAIEAEVVSAGRLPADVDDILHYVKALNYGMKRLREDGFPISSRLIRELHRELMHQARATQYSSPGEFRTTQNWIGGTRPGNARFVPPPPAEVARALGDLENFIHADDDIPVVIRTGIIHAQFETIHPFADGNGRTGRMLIPLYLWHKRFLEIPVLFLSSYFKRHQSVYYEKLSAWHEGNVHEWLDFFLDGVMEIAAEAAGMADRIRAVRQRDMDKVQSLGQRAAASAMQVLSRLYGQPIVTASVIQSWTGYSRAGSYRVLERFIGQGILVPWSNEKAYGQSYVYKDYLDIFTAGD